MCEGPGTRIDESSPTGRVGPWYGSVLDPWSGSILSVLSSDLSLLGLPVPVTRQDSRLWGLIRDTLHPSVSAGVRNRSS